MSDAPRPEDDGEATARIVQCHLCRDTMAVLAGRDYQPRPCDCLMAAVQEAWEALGFGASKPRRLGARNRLAALLAARTRREVVK